MAKVKIYSAFEKPLDPGISFKDPSMTQQHHKDDCDINKIMTRFKATGILPHQTSATPRRWP